MSSHPAVLTARSSQSAVLTVMMSSHQAVSRRGRLSQLSSVMSSHPAVLTARSSQPAVLTVMMSSHQAVLTARSSQSAILSDVISSSCPHGEVASVGCPHSDVISSSCPHSEVVSVSCPHLLSEPGGELLLAAGTQPVGPLQVPRVLLQLLALAPARRQLRHLQLLVEVAGAAEAVTGAGGRSLVPYVTGGGRGERRGGGVAGGVPAVVLVAVDTRETGPLAVPHLGQG